jgi:hypothetical protein
MSEDKSDLPAGTPATKLSGVPHWEESPEAYERVIIRGVTLPGTATVTGEGYKRKVDTKKAAGQHGDTTTDLGEDSAKIEVQLDLWTPQHLTDFQSVVKKVLAPRRKVIKEEKDAPLFVGYTGADASTQLGAYASYNQHIVTTRVEVAKGPGPVDIYYPTLALFGITKVQVLAIGLPTPKSPGVWTVKLTCTQYIAHKKKAAVTTGDYAKRLGGNVFENPQAQANAPSATTTGPNYTPGALTSRVLSSGGT